MNVPALGCARCSRALCGSPAGAPRAESTGVTSVSRSESTESDGARFVVVGAPLGLPGPSAELAEMVKRTFLIATALGQQSSNGFAPSAQDTSELESRILRGRVPMTYEAILELVPDEENVGAILCEDCLQFCEGYLRQRTLEVGEMLLGARQLVRSNSKLEAQKREAATTAAQDSSEEEIEALLLEQQELVKGIADLEQRQIELDEKSEKLDEEETDLAKMEDAYWREMNALRMLADVIGEKTDSLMNEVSDLKNHMKELTPIHAFNDAFFIWRDGDYGTINGFRLGQIVGRSRHHKPAAPPESENKPAPGWEEVNTAWGLSAMLLNAIASSCNFELPGFQIEPIGARSVVKRFATTKSTLKYLRTGYTVLPLYLDPEKTNTMFDRVMKVAKIDAVENFNAAMRCFLICLSWLCEAAITSESGKALQLSSKMYKIDVPDENARQKGIPANSCTINGDSVDMNHLPFYPERQIPPSDIEHAYRWTVALRHVLTNLKWLLVWSVKDKTSRRLNIK